MWSPRAAGAGQRASKPGRRRIGTATERYANVVVTSLAEMAPDSGRNDALNRAAWVLGGWVAAGALELDAAEDALYGAAEANGLVEDDGEAQCWRTIRSGLAAGLRSPVDLDADNAPLIDVDAVLRSDPITGEVMSEADLARVLGAVA